MNRNPPSKGEIVLYQTKDKKVELQVKLEQETVWLTQEQIAKLFGSERSVVTKHISNIFHSKELEEERNVQKMHIPYNTIKTVPNVSPTTLLLR